MTLQLKNIQHNFSVALGDVGVTVRLGDKWAKLVKFTDKGLLTKVDLWECKEGHEGDCATTRGCKFRGQGELIGFWSGQFDQLPPNLLSIEHDPACRKMTALAAAMTKAYGEKFKHTSQVTALIYTRTGLGDK